MSMAESFELYDKFNLARGVDMMMALNWLVVVVEVVVSSSSSNWVVDQYISESETVLG